MDFETIIGEAIFSGNHVLGECRATCKLVAMHQITCKKCGRILDQRGTVVAEIRDDNGTVKTLGAICSTCRNAQQETPRLRRQLVDLALVGQHLALLSWDGLERLRPPLRDVLARHPRQMQLELS